MFLKVRQDSSVCAVHVNKQNVEVWSSKLCLTQGLFYSYTLKKKT